MNNPTGRKVEAVLSQIGLDAEIEYLRFEDGDMQSPDYMQINPNGKVPTLVDGETVLWESNAIMMYLCTVKKPDHALFAPKLRPHIMQWLFWESAHYTASVRTVVFELLVKKHFNLGEPNQEVISHGVQEFERYAAVLDKHLEGRDYIVGDDWTLADYAVGFSQPVIGKIPVDLTKFPNIQRFYDRIAANSHWAKTLHDLDQAA